MSAARWIDLDGAANARDLGGLPTADGSTVQAGRLIRSDNLQGLTESDVRLLVDDIGVRAVVDLRTGVEVRSEGPGPLMRESDVEVRNLSLFPEAGTATDAAAAEDGPVVLPWHERAASESGSESTRESGDESRRGAAGVYLRYLDDRADSVLEALRTIAHSDGATVVHCAAGKDRTGVVIAFALAEVGVLRAAIVADYARSAERIEAIFARLRASHTYAQDLTDEVDNHRPRAVTMERLLDAVDDIHGGVPAWLRTHGWSDADAAALRRKLLH